MKKKIILYLFCICYSSPALGQSLSSVIENASNKKTLLVIINTSRVNSTIDKKFIEEQLAPIKDLVVVFENNESTSNFLIDVIHPVTKNNIFSLEAEDIHLKQNLQNLIKAYLETSANLQPYKWRNFSEFNQFINERKGYSIQVIPNSIYPSHTGHPLVLNFITGDVKDYLIKNQISINIISKSEFEESVLKKNDPKPYKAFISEAYLNCMQHKNTLVKISGTGSSDEILQIIQNRISEHEKKFNH